MLRNIILCGFMGSGKTTVGRQLACLTGRRFEDTDEIIVNKTGMTIPEIFEKFSEQHFRCLEREACADLAVQTGLVIAVGGGALTFAANVKVLSATGDIVLLDVPVDMILKRLKDDNTRPLLARSDRENATRALYEQRMPIYKAAAAFTVNAAADANAVAQNIIKTLNLSSL